VVAFDSSNKFAVSTNPERARESATAMVKIERKNEVLLVASPYNPELPSRAKKLGGKWDPAKKAWAFDVREEAEVRKLYKDIYGTDGDDSVKLVTLRVTYIQQDSTRDCSFWMAGREVAHASGRDSGARLGKGISLRAGAFRSGGSMKNPACIVEAGTVVLIRDVPEPAAVASLGAWDAYKCEIEPEEAAPAPRDPSVERSVLLAQISQLQAKVAELDKEIAYLSDEVA